MVLLLVSGATIPLSLLPGWMQWIGRLFPLTYGVSVVRAGMAGARLREVTLPLLLQWATGAVFLAASVLVVRAVEHQICRQGRENLG